MLHELLYTLEPQYRQSLLLVYEQGFTYEQLAAHQNTTVSAVKSKLHRAKNEAALNGWRSGNDSGGSLRVKGSSSVSRAEWLEAGDKFPASVA
ncbi:sigma factor-like helix-turn-helix DNA-binding protein [Paenibacillus gorillae]|uniref:RNA polymerase sigma factor n=1 Tax=Paenibacillus gorillae TaxID=1243662 RepID=UPI0009E049E5